MSKSVEMDREVYPRQALPTEADLGLVALPLLPLMSADLSSGF